MAKGKNVSSDNGAPDGFVKVGGDVIALGEGESFRGIYKQLIPARNPKSSPVLVIETEEGNKRYWAPTILASRFADIPLGAEVYVVCTGQNVPVKNRKTMAWGFDVFTKE